jgi:hypothetical protein
MLKKHKLQEVLLELSTIIATFALPVGWIERFFKKMLFLWRAGTRCHILLLRNPCIIYCKIKVIVSIKVMRKNLLIATIFLGTLSGQAQEKVMNIVKRDGTSTQTRVADLKQISFLTVDEVGQGLLVKTLGGETAAVLFEANPVVKVSNGKLVISSSTAETVEFEITDIAEILFGETSDETAIGELKGFGCVLQEGGLLLRGIPEGVKPYVYSLDGRCLPTPPFRGGELQLNRATLGTGIYIVKVGTFSAKIKI